jgi:hypothetical protein
MPRIPYHLQQRAWDPVNARYASLKNPEWVTMSRLPLFFWDDDHNHKRYVKWLGMQLGFKKPEDWYAVTSKDFTDRRGHGFLEYYEHSYFRVLEVHFPKVEWKPWLFQQAPNGYWHSIENCAKFVRWFECQRGFTSLDGWYGMTQDDVYELHGAGLMDHFDCSVQRLVRAVHPNHDWKPWLFVQVPKNFWPKRENRVAYMKWLEKKLGYETPHDWYRVTNNDLIDNGGSSLVQLGYKTIDLLRELYPRRTYYPWLFSQVTQGFFQSYERRVEYLRWLGKQLGFKTESDCLTLTRLQFADNGGAPLFDQYYQGDMCNAMREIFPGREWFPWEFAKVPVGFWDDIQNCRAFLTWLGKRLGYESKSDWYKVRRADFRDNLGNGFIKRFKMPYLGLKAAYPNYDWLPWMFENVPVGFWEVKSNRGWYLTWLGKQLRFTRADQWEELSAKQLTSHCGNGLIAKLSVKEIRVEGACWASR